jgi:hypothetical protein
MVILILRAVRNANFPSQSIVIQLLKKSHAFHGSRRFIIVFTKSILIGNYHPIYPQVSQVVSSLRDFRTEFCTFSPLPCVSHLLSSHHSSSYRLITVGEKKRSEEGALQLHAGFLLGLLFSPEDVSNIFLRNAGLLSQDYTALYPRR